MNVVKAPQPEEWCIMAKREGSHRARAMPIAFGLSRSRDEALAKVEGRLRIDLKFRDTYRGWTFYAVRADAAIQVTEAGIIRIFKDEQQSVRIA